MDSKIHAQIRFSYGDFSLDVECDIAGAGVTVIFGRSGSGKTTFLRCLAGLEKAQSAQLRVNGECWQNEKIFLPAHKRPIGFVFQEASLFTHLDVLGNLKFAQCRATKNSALLSFDDVVSLCGVGGLLRRKTPELSGGERQRVAIARALMVQPEVLLMDEPLASLDEHGKDELLSLLERLKYEVKVPVLYVTHSHSEVVRIADEVLVLEGGRVKSHGGIKDVVMQKLFCLSEEHPGSFVEARVSAKDHQWGVATAEFPGGELLLQDKGYRLQQRLRIFIPAKDVSITLSRHEDSSILNILPAVVVSIAHTQELSEVALVELRVGESIFFAQVTRRSAAYLKLVVEQSVWIQIKAVSILK